MDLQEIAQCRRLVEEWSGLCLESVEPPVLARAVQEGMERVGLPSPRQYCAHLRGPEGQQEAHRLVGRLTNNETYFFREPAHFRVLAEHLLPELAAQRALRGEKVRLLSAGCSTGEEPYSMAMALLERRDGLPSFEFEIAAIDIDGEALAKARQGIFGRNSFRGALEAERLATFFVPLEDGQYQLSAEIAARVCFHHLNLHAAPSLREVLGEMDAIFFRNVAIYLCPEASRRVVRALAACLKEGGYLLVASAEVPQCKARQLVLREIEGTFLFEKVVAQKRAAPRAVVRPAPGPATFSPKAASASQEPAPQATALYRQALQEVVQGRKALALERLERLLEADPLHLEACRLLAEIHLDGEDFAGAADLCRRAMAVDPWLVWPHLLLGLICQYQGQYAQAVEKLKEAVYVQPGCWLAHFHLGEAYRLLENIPLAVREYRNALASLEKSGGQTPVLLPGFSPEYLARACRQHLRRLQAMASAGQRP
jgi:chemotaxis protein methyltransferase CheR